MNNIKFKQIALEKVEWKEIDEFRDRTIFQTLHWLKFIERTQDANPIIVAIEKSGQRIGYFTGLIFKKFGLKILGSPFEGWTTSYMGFNLLPEINRTDILKTFPSFIFDELNCHYFEIVDRNIKKEDYKDSCYKVSTYRSLEIDLTKSEEELYSNMKKKSCRWCIRKAEKEGVYIEEASDIKFADEYYEQLLDVFAKQSLFPTYPKTRIQELIYHLLPTGNLLLLRARSKDGKCIGTGIFPAFNDMMVFWGGASWREYQNLRPNELIVWHAMRYWKARGIKRFDMVGWRDYKTKYGAYDIIVPRLMMAKYRILYELRNIAQKVIKSREIVKGHIKNR